MIKGVVTKRVEKDHQFPLTFTSQSILLQKYIRQQKLMQQTNIFNLYYFSNYQPKGSIITQPTTATLFKQTT